MYWVPGCGGGTKAINRDTNTGNLDIYGGTDYSTGAYFKLTGNAKNTTSGNSSGEFTIGEVTGTYASSFAVNSFNGSAWTARLLVMGATGRIGIGVANPTSFFHIRAGNASVGNSPLKFTTGVLLTTPENGAIEYDGTSLYFTRTGTTRETVNTTVTKTGTGDGTGAEGLFQLNTFDKTFKVYSNGAWRSLATW